MVVPIYVSSLSSSLPHCPEGNLTQPADLKQNIGYLIGSGLNHDMLAIFVKYLTRRQLTNFAGHDFFVQRWHNSAIGIAFCLLHKGRSASNLWPGAAVLQYISAK